MRFLPVLPDRLGTRKTGTASWPEITREWLRNSIVRPPRAVPYDHERHGGSCPAAIRTQGGTPRREVPAGAPRRGALGGVQMKQARWTITAAVVGSALAVSASPAF